MLKSIFVTTVTEMLNFRATSVLGSRIESIRQQLGFPDAKCKVGAPGSPDATAFFGDPEHADHWVALKNELAYVVDNPLLGDVVSVTRLELQGLFGTGIRVGDSPAVRVVSCSAMFFTW